MATDFGFISLGDNVDLREDGFLKERLKRRGQRRRVTQKKKRNVNDPNNMETRSRATANSNMANLYKMQVNAEASIKNGKLGHVTYQ